MKTLVRALLARIPAAVVHPCSANGSSAIHFAAPVDYDRLAISVDEPCDNAYAGICEAITNEPRWTGTATAEEMREHLARGIASMHRAWADRA